MTDQALDPPPARPAEAPDVPARTSASPSALPPPAPRFVGRARELAELRAEISRPGLGATRTSPPARPRVLLVVGRPGIGRTAVALELARQVAADYPDGHFFLRLTGDHGDALPPQQVAATLLAAVGEQRHRSATAVVPQGQGPEAVAPAGESQPADAPAALREALAGRRVLIVLDDVVDAGQLTGLLPQTAGSLVVVTSGGPLAGVADVRPSTLGGLDSAAAVALLGQAVGETRVTNDPRGAESLVQEAAGHPTALRLVGAWLAAQPRLSLSEAAARLRAASDTPFPPAPRATDGLAPPDLAAKGAGPAKEGEQAGEAKDGTPGGEPTAGEASGPAAKAPTTGPKPTPKSMPKPTPKSTPKSAPASTPDPAPEPPHAPAPPAAPGELVRAFRLVYESLPGTAARILRLLSLAPAGLVDAQSASALAGCSVPAAQGTLDDFVTGGLLAPGSEQGRYRVPGCLEPLLRGLVETRDRPEDVRLARARMLERTVRLLVSCRAALAGEEPADGLPRTLRFATPAVAAGWLDARLPGLMAAARMAVADGELDTLARRLVAALVRALTAAPAATPALAERYELHRLVLGVAERRGLHRERAAALINLADLDAEAGRPADAVERYRQALGAARDGDDTEAEGRVLEALGGTYLAQQDLPRASDWFGRALALRQARGELADQARLHARIGAVLTYLGRYGPALREWRSAAGVYRRLGDLPSQARALTEAARVQEYAGHPEDALRTCRDALYWARQAGERRLEAAVLLRLADALDRLGDSGGAGLQRAAAQRLFRPGEFPAF
ncbi:tetratricopeptide repeat protein [Streptomyces sp. NBC_01476]|uniref:tetratricopeptide repeat protein n=1 Tax=Streptomyces sp. NBC_01476 TaxID=2903881 RepID=UPI002E3348B4|nr:tetratricopeptide repeat protein [Streptomyces sp. NBC_01476]